MRRTRMRRCCCLPLLLALLGLWATMGDYSRLPVCCLLRLLAMLGLWMMIREYSLLPRTLPLLPLLALLGL